jgi:transcriptional regulator with XRE-family HTH domain
MARDRGSMSSPPPPPPWGAAIREHRERQGRSIRQVASVSGLSDSYWGQVERGHQKSADGFRIIHPSRAVLVLMADTLRLTNRQTNELLALAGEQPVQSADTRPVRGQDVDLRGLSRRDVALLNAIADRFRVTNEAEQDAEPALRAVARDATDARSGRRATELAKEERRKQT